MKIVKLDLKLNGKHLYSTPRGIREGSTGKVESTGTFLGKLAKGIARKVRKALHSAGEVAKAATACSV